MVKLIEQIEVIVSVRILQLDHYPVSTYTLPETSDTTFNLVKSIFLGKVFGKCLNEWGAGPAQTGVMSLRDYE